MVEVLVQVSMNKRADNSSSTTGRRERSWTDVVTAPPQLFAQRQLLLSPTIVKSGRLNMELRRSGIS